MGEHARLSAPRTGEYQQRALPVGDRLALGLVQPLEQLLEVLCVWIRGHQISSIGARSAGRTEARRTDSRLRTGTR